MRTLRTTALNSAGIAKKRLQSRYKVADTAQRRKSRMSDERELFDGRVLIYRTTNSGDVYQARIYVASEQRYVRKSLKTRELEIACKRAENLFFDVSARVRSGEKLFSISAAELRDRFVAVQEELVKAGQLSQGRFGNIKTFTRHYLEFVGENTRIQNIEARSFEKYRAFRQSKKHDIKMDVVLNESLTIKSMYRWAKKEGLIAQNYECDFGKIKTDKNVLRRDVFSVEEYKQLTNVARLWYRQLHDGYESKDEEVYYRKTIRDFIVLQANFGFRTGELLSLQWKDVKIHQDGTADVTIQSEKTNVRKARTVRGRRGGVFARRKEYGQEAEGDDFVFANYGERKQLTKTLLYKYFAALKKQVKKQHSSFNENLDLYSLRHFWITCWLSTGKIDAYQLARYAGTSLNQIQRTYDHMKDSVASSAILSVRWRFDKNNQVVLEDNDKQ